MRVVVINIRGHTDRRVSAATKLSAAGISFEFFDGISGDKALSRQLFEAVDPHEFLLNTGRLVTPGEIGCYASHREVWKLAAERNEPIVVMEDDFELRDGFADALKACTKLIERAGFIRLQNDIRAKKCKGVRAGDFTLCRFTKPPHGLMCYCLSAAVARRFVGATRVLDQPVDIFTKKYWDHGQAMYVLTPYTIYPSDLHSRSTIAGRQKTKKPLLVATHRFVRKIACYLKRWRFNLVQRVRARTVFDDYLPPMALPDARPGTPSWRGQGVTPRVSSL